MIDVEAQIKAIVEEAVKPGPEEPPEDLLAALYRQTDPIKAICDHDTSIAMSEAFHTQFGYLVASGVSSGTQQTTAGEHWTGLLRWVLRELNEWTSASDRTQHRLTALLFCAVCCDRDNVLWALLPNGLEKNEELLSVLGNSIATATTTFGSRFQGARKPIWEQRIIEQFVKAESEERWVTIGELWNYFRDAHLPNVFFLAVSRFLFRFDPERLVLAMENVKQTMLAARVLDALMIEQKLAIGSASNNPHVQFAAALESFSGWHKGKRPTTREEELIKQLLLKVSRDTSRWIQWMRVFNRYPVRYTAIQISLGRVLAESSWNAIEAYIDSIELSVSPASSRVLVAECLEEFRAVADVKRVKRAWRLAYTRWSTWQFGISDPDRYVFEIAFSELDYAVVGYVAQCMTAEDRTAAKTEVIDGLTSILDQWHPSLVACISAWYRLLSSYQPYAHAEYAERSGEAWLQTNRNYWPFDPDKESYVTIMFRST